MAVSHDNTYQIGQKAVKIACYQTIPGHEIDVARALEEACGNEKDITDFVVLKVFGRYDLLVLYSTTDFDFHLTKSKPIAGILKTNLFICHLLDDNSASDIINSVKSKNFTGISFLKLGDVGEIEWPQVLENITTYLESFFAESHVIGTLGWNELIVISPAQDIGDLSRKLLSLYSNYSASIDPGQFKKTFTSLCLNSNILPERRLLDEHSPSSAIEHFRKFPSLENKIDDHKIYISIFVSIAASNMLQAISFWHESHCSVDEVLGRDDLKIGLCDGCTWADFLGNLFFFRANFQENLLGTLTSIAVLAKKNKTIKNIANDAPRALYDDNNDKHISYTTLEKAFGTSKVHALSNSITALSGLNNNPITRDAFFDMLEYPKKIVEMGEVWKNNEKNVLPLIEKSAGAIKKGIEIRAYGTYANIEEIIHGRLSILSGGFQRSLLAVECLPAYLSERLNLNWKGFCVIGDEKFFHINDVIGVPSQALWDPHCWWALYHEIGHILIDNTTSDTEGAWITLGSPEIANFLISRPNKGEWFQLFVELAAEVIGFELGFFGDLKLYTDLFWQHILTVVPSDQKVLLQTYLLRSFYVSIFERHFRKELINIEDMQSEDFLYKELLKHIDYVETSTGQKFTRKFFLAAATARPFAEMYNFSRLINKKIDETTGYYATDKVNNRSFAPLNDDLTNPVTKEVCKAILSGKVWVGKENIPMEAVLYKLFKKQKNNFRTNLAAILTFWHSHRRFIREKMNDRVRK